MSLLKYIGKATDSDLVEMLTAKFEDMSKAVNIKQFYGYESSVLGLLKKLKSGSERSTWRSWFGGIWKYIEGLKKEEGTMMSMLREADRCGSWYEKLEVYSDNSKIDKVLISSRWNTKVRDAARKAFDNIGKIVKIPKIISGEYSEDLAISLLRGLFCSSECNLYVTYDGGKSGDGYCCQFDNKIPILPAKGLIDVSFDGEYLGTGLLSYVGKVFNANVDIEGNGDSVVLNLQRKPADVQVSSSNPRRDKSYGSSKKSNSRRGGRSGESGDFKWGKGFRKDQKFRRFSNG